MAQPNPIDEDATTEPPKGKNPFLTGPQWALFAGMLLVVVTLSVALTVTLLSPGAERDSTTRDHLTAQVAALEDRMVFYERELNSLSTKLEEMEQAQQLSERASIPPALIERLVNQEESLQRFIDAMKQGMQELSHMVPGSREWLDMYHEKLDVVVEESSERAEELHEWAPGE